MTARRDQPQPLPMAEPRSMASQAKSWLGIAALAVLGVFFAQNLQNVEIHFLWWTSDMPMIFALVFSAAIGAGAMYAFSTLRRRSASPAAGGTKQPGTRSPQT